MPTLHSKQGQDQTAQVFIPQSSEHFQGDATTSLSRDWPIFACTAQHTAHSLLQGNTAHSCPNCYPPRPPRVPGCRAAPQPASPSLARSRRLPAQAQELVFACAELQEVPDRSFLQPAKVPVNDSPAVWHINLPQNRYCPQPWSLTKSLTKMLNRTGPSTDPWVTPLATSWTLTSTLNPAGSWCNPRQSFMGSCWTDPWTSHFKCLGL